MEFFWANSRLLFTENEWNKVFNKERTMFLINLTVMQLKNTSVSSLFQFLGSNIMTWNYILRCVWLVLKSTYSLNGKASAYETTAGPRMTFASLNHQSWIHASKFKMLAAAHQSPFSPVWQDRQTVYYFKSATCSVPNLSNVNVLWIDNRWQFSHCSTLQLKRRLLTKYSCYIKSGRLSNRRDNKDVEETYEAC